MARCSGGVRIPTPEIARPSSGKPTGSLAMIDEIAAPMEWAMTTIPARPAPWIRHISSTAPAMNFACPVSTVSLRGSSGVEP